MVQPCCSTLESDSGVSWPQVCQLGPVPYYKEQRAVISKLTGRLKHSAWNYPKAAGSHKQDSVCTVPKVFASYED